MYGGRQISGDPDIEFRSISSRPEWEDFLPDDDLDAKARSVFFLRSVEQNPAMMKAMLTHSWDGRKRDLRNVLNAALKPLDEMLQTQNDPNSLPFEKTVIALRKTRAESGRLRTLERKASKNEKRLQQEKEDWTKAEAECRRNLALIDEALPKCTDTLSACRHSAKLLERNSATMKQVLTDQAVDLLQNYAGINMCLPVSQDEDRQDVLHCLDIPNEPKTRLQTDTDLNRALLSHERELDQEEEICYGYQTTPGRQAHKVPKTVYRTEAQQLQIWQELRVMVNSYEEDPEVDMPEILQQPDGGDPNDLDSTWWARFSVWWDEHVTRFFSGRDHIAAAAWLAEWKILVQQQEDQDEAEQEDLDNAELIASRTAMVCQTVQAMLDQGSFSQPEEILFLNTFLHGLPENRDLEALDQVLLRSTRQSPPPPQEEEEAAAVPQAMLAPRQFIDAVFSEKMVPGVWTHQLANVVSKGRMTSSNAGALQLMIQKYLGLVWTRNKDEECFRKRLKHYEWATGCLGYLASFLSSVHSTDYLRLANRSDTVRSRISRLGPSRQPDILKRRETYLCFSEQLALMCKYYSTERYRPVPSTKKKALAPWGNLFHRDSWIVDFPLCDLATALRPGGAREAGIAGPWDYTMGGWLCLRCLKVLITLRGNCRCLCFRGHLRTECAMAGSGCYGFHPCRFMECMALGLPSTTQGKKIPSRFSYEERIWTHRQRRHRWREFVKEIVQGRDPWFGVVPEEKRGLDMSSWVTEDLSELLQDWFINLDWDRFQVPIDDEKRVRARLDKIAKFHLDLLLDRSKYLPEKLSLYAPNQNKSPNWRWIDYGCPICSVWMEVNKSNTCRGLCNGCRAWQSILGPEKTYIASGPPYNVFERDGGLGNRKRKRNRNRHAAAAAAAAVPRRTITVLPMATSLSLLAVRPTAPRRRRLRPLAISRRPRELESRRGTPAPRQTRVSKRRHQAQKKKSKQRRHPTMAPVCQDTLLDSGRVHPLFTTTPEIVAPTPPPSLPLLFTDTLCLRPEKKPQDRSHHSFAEQASTQVWIQPLSVSLTTAALFASLAQRTAVVKAVPTAFDTWMEPLSVPLKTAALFAPAPPMPTLFDAWVTKNPVSRLV